MNTKGSVCVSNDTGYFVSCLQYMLCAHSPTCDSCVTYIGVKFRMVVLRVLVVLVREWRDASHSLCHSLQWFIGC